jgi:glyoxylase-like metal-dependent hydrolase (beta-lactamase superfamily II)
MILRQFLHTDPVALSYLFGCGGKASGAVVDPVGEVSRYVEAAAQTGMRILYVIDTHIHADHVSTGRTLAETPAPSTCFSMKPRSPLRFAACATAISWNSAMSRSK